VNRKGGRALTDDETPLVTDLADHEFERGTRKSGRVWRGKVKGRHGLLLGRY